MKELLGPYIPEIWHKPILVGGIFFATIIIAAVVLKLFNVYIRKARKDSEADITSIIFLKRALVVLIYMAGISFALYQIEQFRIIAKSLLAGAGLLALVVGFASQQTLANIISGVFIVIFKPYRIDDRISLRTDLFGVVEDINLRHTVIRNFENKRIIIPNSLISNEVLINSNYQDDLICKFVEIGISYDSDVDKARAIMQEEAEKHPDFVDNRSPEEKEEGVEKVRVRVIMLGDFSVTLRAWTWASGPQEAYFMGCDLLESIKKRFDKEGIEIPFPYRTLVYKKDLQEGVRGEVKTEN